MKVASKPKQDLIINLAVGNKKTDKKWKSEQFSWSALLEKFSKPERKPYTLAQYRALSEAQRAESKDGAGFVGGLLKEGIRRKENVMWRNLITLDADYCTSDVIAQLQLLADFSWCAYSTHSHTPENPRYRVVIPTSEPMSVEEYEPIARMVAKDFDIENFDDVSYRVHQLMYWPSHPSDIMPEFYYHNGAFLNPKQVLARYVDWRDQLEWPRSSRTSDDLTREAKKAGDPLDKPGLIGAFNRTYDVHQAIATFLPDVYTQTPYDSNRYTFVSGSTAGGMVVYNDGLIAYSNHATDPAGNKACNAFDLVRIHLFGHLDDGSPDVDKITKALSFKEMEGFCATLDEVQINAGLNIIRNTAGEDFAQFIERSTDGVEEAEHNFDWLKLLERDEKRQDKFQPTANNLQLIMMNDPSFKDNLKFNSFTKRSMVTKDLPWRKARESAQWLDSDDSSLRIYIERFYGISAPMKVMDALNEAFTRNSFHPVQEYLTGLVWDGASRVDALLIDYQGAEDNQYVRAVTRKTLVAAVARIMRPGCKFDNMLVLIGSQGIGKSSLFSKLAGEWFSDSLSTVHGKEAYEQLQGHWIIEMGEMSATRKADVEAIKHFLSKTRDSFRAAYGRVTTDNPRSCIFVGTTNDDEFLMDKTGNRRFWPVEVQKEGRTKDVFKDLDEQEIGQIWAEAYQLWKGGETLFLEAELAAEAIDYQKDFTQEHPYMELIKDFLERPIPLDWYSRSILERKSYLQNYSMEKADSQRVLRNKICSIEVWVEMLGNDIGKFPKHEQMEISSCLKHLEGWKRNTKDSKISFGEYGRQRCYFRVDHLDHLKL